ncbi:hypothetical protein [Microvirga tunisiensis]|uniref:Uncharacterized protein n=1 Tax=Microvirga tunisiensis TaxID=2108360 RepID=A0A5N7MES2_9HYPH|nr:hypothetical protein [Microvirga tunisiensis]MPR06502.1 hypothetical protein [Microvirga tunisiensis]MPR24624.1 hypothetical protein [Microvirga tunisiensis]
MFITAKQITKNVERLYEILTKELSLTTDRSGGVEEGVLTMWDILEVLKDPPQTADQALIDKLVVGAGVHDLSAKICAVWDHFPLERGTLEPHLKLLAGTKFITQNAVNDRWTADGANGRQHDDADKIIELYWACLCIIAGMKVDLDDPVNSSGGKNPDVIATATDGIKWGFALKTLARVSNPVNVPSNMSRLMRGGIKQINASSVDKGMVVLNMKNVIDHDLIRQTMHIFGWDKAREQLVSQVANYTNDLHLNHSHDLLADLQASPRVAPQAALVAHVATPTNIFGRTVMTEVNAMVEEVFPPSRDDGAGSYAAEVHWLLWTLNDVVQKVR